MHNLFVFLFFAKLYYEFVFVFATVGIFFSIYKIKKKRSTVLRKFVGGNSSPGPFIILLHLVIICYNWKYWPVGFPLIGLRADTNVCAPSPPSMKDGPSPTLKMLPLIYAKKMTLESSVPCLKFSNARHPNLLHTVLAAGQRRGRQTFFSI